MVLSCGVRKILESLLGSKEIKPVNTKGNQPWIFIGTTDVETPILWPLDAKSWLIGKDLDAGNDWGQEKGTAEDEMVGWNHWCNGHEFEQSTGDSEGQGRLVCFSSWVCRVRHYSVTEQQQWKVNLYTNTSSHQEANCSTNIILCMYILKIIFGATYNKFGMKEAKNYKDSKIGEDSGKYYRKLIIFHLFKSV